MPWADTHLRLKAETRCSAPRTPVCKTRIGPAYAVEMEKEGRWIQAKGGEVMDLLTLLVIVLVIALLLGGVGYGGRGRWGRW